MTFPPLDGSSQVAEVGVAITTVGHIELTSGLGDLAVETITLLVLSGEQNVESQRQDGNAESQATANRDTLSVKGTGESLALCALGFGGWRTYASFFGKRTLLTKELHCPNMARRARPAPLLE